MRTLRTWKKTRSKAAISVSLALILSPPVASSLPETGIHFENVTHSAKLLVDGRPIAASRAAWGDFDGDGWPDLLLDGHILMRNRGDGTFENVSREAGLNAAWRFEGGIWGDFNNDGRLDFYGFHQRSENETDPKLHDRLLLNLGNGKFQDVTEEAGGMFRYGPTQAVAWGDIDNNGLLALYVAQYEKRGLVDASGGALRAIGSPHYLWVNQGDGTFKEESIERGVFPRDGVNRCGRGVSFGDFNNDGRMDIYVCNYRLDPNFLYVNQGNGTFTEEAEKYGVRGFGNDGNFAHSLGAAWGDVDNDGNLDLFVGNLAHPHLLHCSNPAQFFFNRGRWNVTKPPYSFAEGARSSGVQYWETHCDPSFADIDNDGLLDLYLTSVYPGQPSFLYRNLGNRRFVMIDHLTNSTVHNAYGHAWADFNRDGRLDVVVCSPDGCVLLKNQSETKNWLRVALRGTKSNRNGVGARLYLSSGIGRFQTREIAAGRGFSSQDEMIAHFGLGTSSGPYSLEVRWPSGVRTKLKIVEVNKAIEISESGCSTTILDAGSPPN